MSLTNRRTTSGGYVAALLAPIALTALLSALSTTQSRDYVFLYLAVVAMLGVLCGLGPPLVAAAASFLLVDWFFVEPLHTFTIADETDLVNLAVFFGVAGLVGSLGSHRRRAQLRAEALAGELRRANSELERLAREEAEAAAVAVRLAQTQQQVRALEAADQMRRELLANVSHELRTPLGAILTGVTGQADRADLPADTRSELRAVAGEAERLGRMVADMLDLARLDAHAMDLQLSETNMADAIAAAVERLRLRAPDRRVAIEARGGPLDVLADWDRLGQVLDNLLSNADRNSPSGADITIEVGAGKRSMAVITVADLGPGVPPELRPHLFQRFVRDEREGKAGASTGLGLAIARGLVEAHAGRLWLEEDGSTPGARFSFTLPLTAEPGVR